MLLYYYGPAFMLLSFLVIYAYFSEPDRLTLEEAEEESRRRRALRAERERLAYYAELDARERDNFYINKWRDE